MQFLLMQFIFVKCKTTCDYVGNHWSKITEILFGDKL